MRCHWWLKDVELWLSWLESVRAILGRSSDSCLFRSSDTETFTLLVAQLFVALFAWPTQFGSWFLDALTDFAPNTSFRLLRITFNRVLRLLGGNISPQIVNLVSFWLWLLPLVRGYLNLGVVLLSIRFIWINPALLHHPVNLLLPLFFILLLLFLFTSPFRAGAPVRVVFIHNGIVHARLVSLNFLAFQFISKHGLDHFVQVLNYFVSIFDPICRHLQGVFEVLYIGRVKQMLRAHWILF